MDLNEPKIKASQSQEAVTAVTKESALNINAKDSPRKKKKEKEKNKIKGVTADISLEGSKVLAPTTSKGQKKKEKNLINVIVDDDVNFVKKKKLKDNNKGKSKRKDRKKPQAEVLTKNLKLFAFDDISQNSQASTLIHDLINCFMTGSSVEKSEAKSVSDILYRQTVNVFLDVLNTCVERIMKKLLESDFLEKMLQKKVSKQDACCQTDS